MRLIRQRTEAVLGIDVGTQSTKCVVLSDNGDLLGIGQHGYGVQKPRPNWAEQSPDEWWNAAISAVRDAMRQANIPPTRICGIGLAGQMHGLVVVDHNLLPLRPAIIWLDRRSANLCDTVLERVGHDTAVQIAGNRLSPGFAAASLAWLNEVEPDTLAQARAVLQPKDYLVLRLTGELCSEPSDASATWLFDIHQRVWSPVLAEACGVPLDILPPVTESADVVGHLRTEAADALGLREGLPVVAGAADQAALLLGAGVIDSGRGSLTLGTGGQITIVSNRPRIDPELRLNTFFHAVPGLWYTMGAILNGGIALRWWRQAASPDDNHSYPELLATAEHVPAGSDGLIFLPYLEGERTPHMDPQASGAFVGLTLHHTQAHLTRAVLEGVAFAFRDCLLTLQETGPVPDHFLIGGGGSQSGLWRRILASVLGVSLQTVEGSEHTAMGAALLAGLGANLFYDLPQAVAHAVHYGPTVTPDPAEQAIYGERHAQFQALYPALRNIR
ncbi:MAG: xylulokinase [Anaerolineae bacterium]|nr:xylulokinase [Anaerolineae bacterium]